METTRWILTVYKTYIVFQWVSCNESESVARLWDPCCLFPLSVLLWCHLLPPTVVLSCLIIARTLSANGLRVGMVVGSGGRIIGVQNIVDFCKGNRFLATYLSPYSIRGLKSSRFYSWKIRLKIQFTSYIFLSSHT